MEGRSSSSASSSLLQITSTLLILYSQLPLTCTGFGLLVLVVYLDYTYYVNILEDAYGC